jgi:hypothetical protein
MTPIAGIKNYIFEILFKHLQAETRLDHLEVMRVNPPGGRLVPLEGEDVVMISNLDVVGLFPSPPPIRLYNGIRGLFRRVFCVYLRLLDGRLRVRLPISR